MSNIMYHKYIKYKTKYNNLKLTLESQYKVSKEEITDELDDIEPYKNTITTTQGDEVFYEIDKLETQKKSLFTTKVVPNKFTILLINDIATFDIFTNKYGYIDGVSVKIDWKQVKGDFKGIYLSPSTELKQTRFDKLLFKGNTYESWWEDDWEIDAVLILNKYAEIPVYM